MTRSEDETHYRGSRRRLLAVYTDSTLLHMALNLNLDRYLPPTLTGGSICIPLIPLIITLLLFYYYSIDVTQILASKIYTWICTLSSHNTIHIAYLTRSLIHVATYLYKHQAPIVPPESQHTIKAVCMSDTHNTTPEVPSADLLLHSGDMTDEGTFPELQAQLRWLNNLPHGRKVVIPGNHDLLLDPNYHLYGLRDRVERLAAGPPAEDLLKHERGDLVVLVNSSATISVKGKTLKIFGSPQTPRHGTGGFTYWRWQDAWAGLIPEGLDILLTHGPQKGHLDFSDMRTHEGCRWYNRELWRLHEKPRLIVHGHIHEGRGREDVDWGLVQWCYDAVISNNRDGVAGCCFDITMLFVMVLGWLYVWMRYWTVGRHRVGKTTLVNVAIKGRSNLPTGVPRIVEI